MGIVIQAGPPDFTIEVTDAASLEESVREDTADPYTGIRIRSNDSYLYGSEDRWPKNWTTYFVSSLLEIVPEIASGEKAMVANHNGPSYFVFEPAGEGSVEITHVFSREAVDDPEERSEQMPITSVSLSTYIETIISLGISYQERLLSINPSLKSHEDIRLLSRNTEEAEAVLSEIDLDS